MTTLAPEKHTGTQCGEMIGQGLVSYRCELEQGHAMIPESDPEPHYAVEIGRSVRAWQAWKQRQMERDAHPAVTLLGGVTCPTCGKGMRESDLGAVCVDPSCPQQPIHIAGSSTATFPEEDRGSDSMTVASVLTQKPGSSAAWEDVSDLGRINASELLESYACPRSVVHEHHYWGLKGEVAVFQCKGDLSDPPAVAKDDPAFAAEPDDGLREFVATHQIPSATSAYDEDMPGPVGQTPEFVAPDPPRIPSWLIYEPGDVPTAQQVEQIEKAYAVLMEETPPAEDEILTIVFESGNIRTRVVSIHDPKDDLDQTVVMPEGVAGDAPPAAVRQTRVWATPDLDPLNLPRVEGCGRCEEITQDPHPGLATWTEFVVNHFDRDHDIVLTAITDEDEFAGWVEPTKQREGDQQLPDGGVECVQDRIIEEMEESKRVGMVRYGSVLHTFNGRNSLLDAAEEARDLHVYLTQIRMEAEATRDQLEVVVTSRIGPLLAAWGADDEGIAGIASVAVDAVMGWVTGQSTSSVHDQPTG